MFVHFPIAFYFLELLLLLFWAWKSDGGCLRFAAISFWAGYFFMLASLISGYAGADGWEHIAGATRKHFFMALLTLVFYSVRALYWRFAVVDSSKFRMTQLAGAMVGNILVAYTAYLGGMLVYS